MNDITVVIASHKKYRMPDDRMYLPLQVGAESCTEDFGYEKDNSGDNISFLNPSFCELTALYWAWKNLNSGYIGLVHYRRYLCIKKAHDPFNQILSYPDIKPFIDSGKYRIFLPKKRRYYIETLYSHYAHTHYIEHLDLARQIIKESYPDYTLAFDSAVNKTSGYMFNMAIMRHDDLDAYCSWLFSILFELRGKIDSSDLSLYQGRLYGRVSEILLNVWLEKQLNSGDLQRNELMEFAYCNTERISIIKKGTLFLAAKFFGRKYKKSF